MSNFGRIEETIFIGARDLANPQERAAYLDNACGDDRALRERVERMLNAEQKADQFLANNPLVPLSPALSPSDEERETGRGAEAVGSMIGRYRLLQQIGEGGCGIVYMAEQEQPIRRRVALKVIKPGMDTRQVIARFEAERQALALMDHPNIARILDAGMTGSDPSQIANRKSQIFGGRPYFVMELVRGIRITEYCDQNNLATRERLDLFTKVVQAVQHAHQKGIIHRDLKPSNVLVTLHDGVPVPKVIDFGIAKALEQKLTDKTLFTQFEQFIGTPSYTSPEQAEMSGLDIDTRSDIYSLGVLLYELLVGQTPFDARELLQSGLDEMRRIIREQEPMRPSTKLSQTLVAADVRRFKSTSSGRPATEEEIRASSRRLLRVKDTIALLRGDLDWIVMKCLEKDRTRRYDTANGLSNDIQHYLGNEPVTARPPSRFYKFGKLVRRNKLVFAASTAVALALVTGIVVSTWQAARARRAEQVAKEERDSAEAMLRFLEHPKVLWSMRNVVVAHTAVGKSDQALSLNEMMLELTKAKRGAEHPNTLLLMMNIAGVHASDGKFDQALPLYEETYKLMKARFGPEDPGTLWTMYNLAEARYRRGKYAGAEPLYRKEVQDKRATFDPEHEELIGATASLGRLLADWAWAERDADSEIRDSKSETAERAREAEGLLRECLAVRLRSTNATHWRVGDVRSRLGGALVSVAGTDRELNVAAREAKLAEAETLLLEGNQRVQESKSAEKKYKRDALERLTRLYEVWSRPDQLSEWRQKLNAFDQARIRSTAPAEQGGQ